MALDDALKQAIADLAADVQPGGVLQRFDNLSAQVRASHEHEHSWTAAFPDNLLDFVDSEALIPKRCSGARRLRELLERAVWSIRPCVVIGELGLDAEDAITALSKLKAVFERPTRKRAHEDTQLSGDGEETSKGHPEASERPHEFNPSIAVAHGDIVQGNSGGHPGVGGPPLVRNAEILGEDTKLSRLLEIPGEDTITLNGERGFNVDGDGDREGDGNSDGDASEGSVETGRNDGRTAPFKRQRTQYDDDDESFFPLFEPGSPDGSIGSGCTELNHQAATVTGSGSGSIAQPADLASAPFPTPAATVSTYARDILSARGAEAAANVNQSLETRVFGRENSPRDQFSQSGNGYVSGVRPTIEEPPRIESVAVLRPPAPKIPHAAVELSAFDELSAVKQPSAIEKSPAFDQPPASQAQAQAHAQRSGDQHQTPFLVQHGFAEYATHHVRTLLPDQWLSDEIVISMLDLYNPDPSLIHVVSPHVVSIHTPLHDLRTKRTSKMMTQSHRQIIVPINIRNKHWVVGVIDRLRSTYHVYDSLQPANCTAERALGAYAESLPSFFDLEKHAWKRGEDPWLRQDDNSSCGVRSIVYGIYAMHGRPRPEQVDLDLWRRIFYAAIADPYLPLQAEATINMAGILASIDMTALYQLPKIILGKIHARNDACARLQSHLDEIQRITSDTQARLLRSLQAFEADFSQRRRDLGLAASTLLSLNYDRDVPRWRELRRAMKQCDVDLATLQADGASLAQVAEQASELGQALLKVSGAMAASMGGEK